VGQNEQGERENPAPTHPHAPKMMFQVLVLAVLCCIAQCVVPCVGVPSSSSPSSFLESMNPADLFVDATEASSYFESLSEEELQTHWSHSEGLPLAEQAAALLDTLDMHSNGLEVHVDVVLVGFNGDGNMELRLARKDVVSFFGGEAAKQQSYFAMRYTHNVIMPRTSQLVARVHEAVQTQVNRNGEGVHVVPVPRAAIDEIVKAHHDTRTSRSSAYTIYILNPPVPTHGSGENVKRAHYTLVSDAAAASSLAPSSCGSNVGMGLDGRYVWIDLTAQQSVFGPRTSGTGVVTRYSLPNLERLFVRDTAALRSKLVVTGGMRIGQGDPDAVPMRAQESTLYAAKTQVRVCVCVCVFSYAYEYTWVCMHIYIYIYVSALRIIQLLLGELFDAVRRVCVQLITPAIEVFPVEYAKHTDVDVLVVHMDPDWREEKRGSTDQWTGLQVGSVKCVCWDVIE
jgi:hypothetical protein